MQNYKQLGFLFIFIRCRFVFRQLQTLSSFKEEMTFHNLTEKPLKLVWKADVYENDRRKENFANKLNR